MEIPPDTGSPAKSSDVHLIRSLLLVAREISTSEAPDFRFQRRNYFSIIRKSKLLSFLFEELLQDRSNLGRPISPSAVLCLKEILIVFQRGKAMLDDLSCRSRFWLLVQLESVANAFHELEVDLATLLDILPVQDLDLIDDVKDQVSLVKSQCRKSKPFVDEADGILRSDVLSLIDGVEHEITPERSKLASIFRNLGLDDSRGCRNEIKALETEIQSQCYAKSTATIEALIGIVRYGKCVLFGASTPRSNAKPNLEASDISFPPDFRCPISLDLMRDPVVVATGQTYDRASIRRWIESGQATCPKTGQTLAHSNLTPNRALKNLIATWCREMRIPFDQSERNGVSKGVSNSKAAMEATRMTALYLVEQLGERTSPDAANRLVHELRGLAKTGSVNRAWIAEAGAIELLIPLLSSDDPSLQINAVTALLNLSILEANKNRIMEAEGGFDAVVCVLTRGATWEARENATATLLSLSTVNAYRKRIGKDTRVITSLVDIIKEGPASSKRDALAAALNLTGDRDAIGLLLEGGLVEVTLAAVSEVTEEAVTVLAAVAKRGGALAVGSADGAVATLLRVLNCGTERARESAAAALVSICRRGRSPAVAQFVGTPGIERVIFELMGSGTPRARTKAAALLQVCRRWLIAGHVNETVRRFEPHPTMLQA